MLAAGRESRIDWRNIEEASEQGFHRRYLPNLRKLIGDTSDCCHESNSAVAIRNNQNMQSSP